MYRLGKTFSAAKAIKAIKAIKAASRAWKPVGMERFYHSLQGFLKKHARWLFGISEPSKVLQYLFVYVFATGVINDPVEFAIFAYVDTWAGLGGWGGDDDVSFTAHMWHAMDLTFLALAHMWHATQVMGRVGWVGWGWWRFFHLHTCDMLRTWRFLHLHTCDMLRTWRFLHLHTCDMLRKSWGGLGGWGGDDDVSFTCTHVTCYALDVSCTCTHVTCYGLGNQSLNVALWNLPVFPTTKCSLQSGTLKLDWQGLKR